MNKNIEIGMMVKRVASDYTNGRIGRVIELAPDKPRARVLWEKESDGTPMKLRTWVRLSDLAPIPSDTKGIEIRVEPPFQISPRLMVGLPVGGGWVQLEYSRRPGDEGRVRYRWVVDLPDGQSFSGDDLQSGCQGGSLEEGFQSLLSFLGAFAESVSYGGENGDLFCLFPEGMAAWACENSDALDPSLIEESRNQFDN
jgi:hypothetical protein